MYIALYILVISKKSHKKSHKKIKQTQKNLYIKCIYIVIYGMYGTERAGCYMHPHPPTRPYKNISENTKKKKKKKNLQNPKIYFAI